MERTIGCSWFAPLLFLLFCANTAIACDADAPCDQCPAGSEFSWNPSDAYATDRLRRFYAVGDELEAARGAGDDARVEALAREGLDLAAIYRCNWNHGNAIHDANRALGLVAMKRGDLDTAEGFLRAAGNSPGSPQLDSFGPELDLADALLQQGRSKAVVDYLKAIQRFWDSEGSSNIESWLAQIEQGEKPRLDRFGPVAPRSSMTALLVSIALWPLFATAGAGFAMRARLPRPGLYAVCAVIAGYAATAAGILIGARIMAVTLVTFPVAAVLAFALPLAIIVVVARLFMRRGEVRGT